MGDNGRNDCTWELEEWTKMKQNDIFPRFEELKWVSVVDKGISKKLSQTWGMTFSAGVSPRHTT